MNRNRRNKKMFDRAMSLFLSAVMVVGMVPALSTAAEAYSTDGDSSPELRDDRINGTTIEYLTQSYTYGQRNVGSGSRVFYTAPGVNVTYRGNAGIYLTSGTLYFTGSGGGGAAPAPAPTPEQGEGSFVDIECNKTDCPLHTFPDVDAKKWYHDGVHYCIENGIMNGTVDGTFAPDLPTSRAMIVTILWRLEGSPKPATNETFPDITPNAWHRQAVIWANANGIVLGGDGLFNPDGAVTREQLAAILFRYAQYKGYDMVDGADLEKFTDADDISSYALSALGWANNAGLINGISDDLLDPEGDASRAQVANIIYRFCKNVVK